VSVPSPVFVRDDEIDDEIHSLWFWREKYSNIQPRFRYEVTG
jgi:hypothetical protein